MKYAVIQVSNGNFSIASEWTEKEDKKAFVNLLNIAAALWNAEDVQSGCVAVVDEEMRIHKCELIKHDNA